jgi:putative CocE/NonD family hydrolase
MDSNRLPDMSENPIARVVLRMLVKGLQPVDGDTDRAQLAAAVREHEGNQHPDEQMVHIRYRDETIEGVPGEVTLETASPFNHAAAMESSGVAIYGWAGWLDGGFIREMLNLYATVRSPGNRIVIGPWGHGGRWYTSPMVKRRTATHFDHIGEMVRFFDLHLRGRDAGIGDEPPIHYFTMGAERWHDAYEWPLPGTTMTAFHLGANATLVPDAPTGPDQSDRSVVDFATGTGVHSRFGKHLSGGRYPVKYPRRARRDRRLLTYTSARLTDDLEVTGEGVVTLFVSSTATDGAFLVYVEDVDPNGTVRVCTDGGLRAAFRATGPAPYPVNVPFHPCRRADEQPLEPGVVTELTFGLFAVSWLFRAGHRIRVAIAGADKDNFAAVAEDQSPVIDVHHGAEYPSRVELPVRPRA